MMTATVVPSPLPQVGADQTLRVLMLPDLHLPAKPEAAQRVLDNRDYLDSMDYVQLLGDMVRCYATRREYAKVDAFIKGLKRPYGAVNGNHEFWFLEVPDDSPLYGFTWDEASPELQRHALGRFKWFYDYSSLWRAEHNALGHWLFLGLDGVGLWKQETLSEPQLAFLLEQIREAGRAPLYIFCHAPLMLGRKIDMTYYDEARSGCVELEGEVAEALSSRRAPTLWMSGHIHLHPDHYLFAPYELAPNVWQVHCPDGWGYSRWLREQHCPERHEGTFTRHLEATCKGVELVAFDHVAKQEVARHNITF